MKDMYCGQLGISLREVYNYGQQVLEGLKEKIWIKIDEVAEYNQLKVAKPCRRIKLQKCIFHGTSGYGYNDEGRDTLREYMLIYSKTEDALVRPQIICEHMPLMWLYHLTFVRVMNFYHQLVSPYDTMDGLSV